MNNDTPADAMDLKPCPNPWCEAEERDGDFSPVAHRIPHGNWQVSCTSCEQKGPIRAYEDHAIQAWNTRTTSLAAQDGLVEALESALRYSLWNDAMVRQGMTQDEAIKHVSDTVAAIKGDKS